MIYKQEVQYFEMQTGLLSEMQTDLLRFQIKLVNIL